MVEVNKTYWGSDLPEDKENDRITYSHCNSSYYFRKIADDCSSDDRIYE
jgi:hypothetical protein